MLAKCILLPVLLAVCTIAADPVGHGATVDYVYQYDYPAWIENLAVRPNGFILPATATSAVLEQLNPITGKLEVVADFSEHGNAIMSIADMHSDRYLVNTMYCDLSILSCTPGSGITWLVDFGAERPDKSVHVKNLATGPAETSVLNGVVTLNDHVVLMVDQRLGGIWGVDVDHDKVELLFTDPSMMDPNNTGNGVNGIRVRKGTLYFNNPSVGTFNRIAIDSKSGRKAGAATTIASDLSPDDFEIDGPERSAYITNGPADQLLKIDLNTGLHTPLVEGLAGPTTARWVQADKRRCLYVATTGGYDQWLSGNATVGGTIWKVCV